MPLFEVVILEAPKKAEKEEGKQERLIYGPKPIIAKDSFTATLDAVMECTVEFDKERMIAQVRPF